MSNVYENCPECGAAVEDGALFCGDCGYKFDNLTKTENAENSEAIAASLQKHKFVLIVIIAVIALLAVLAVINLSGNKNVSSSASTNMFSEGLLAVEDSSGRWGYINQKGEYVISPQFSEAYPFDSDGTAVVFVGDKLAIIDRKGKFVVQPKLKVSYTEYFEGFADNGLALVDDDKYIDKKGNVVIELENAYGYSFAKNGLALVSIHINDEQRYGYIDKTGDYAIEPKFSEACNFNDDGLAAVYDEIKGQWGFIDKSGNYKITIPYNYRYMGSSKMTKQFSSNGWMAVYSDNGYGIINEKGEIVVNAQFDSIVAISNGWALVTKRDEDGREKYGFVTPKGEIIEPQFDYALYSSSLEGACLSDNNLQPVCKDGKWGYIDETGSFVIEPQFDLASVFSDGYAKITIGDSGGIINSKGEYDSLPYLAYSMTSFIGDLNFVEYTETEWACVDKSGKKVISIDFDVNEYTMSINNKVTELLPIDDAMLLPFFNDGYTFFKSINASNLRDIMKSGAFDYDYLENLDETYAIMDSKGNIIAHGFKGMRTESGLIM